MWGVPWRPRDHGWPRVQPECGDLGTRGHEEEGGRRARTQQVTREGSWLHVHLHRSTTPLPLALSSGITVAARNGICQGIFWFNSRKNIPTGEKAALGLWETPDIKNLKWNHTAFYQKYG